jgi:hypothetical protein
MSGRDRRHPHQPSLEDQVRTIEARLKYLADLGARSDAARESGRLSEAVLSPALAAATLHLAAVWEAWRAECVHVVGQDRVFNDGMIKMLDVVVERVLCVLAIGLMREECPGELRREDRP